MRVIEILDARYAVSSYITYKVHISSSYNYINYLWELGIRLSRDTDM